MGLRITLSLLQLLAILLEERVPLPHGLALQKELNLSNRAIYNMLHKLEDLGYVRSALEDIDEKAEGRRKRRLWQLSPKGKEFALEKISHARSVTGFREALI